MENARSMLQTPIWADFKSRHGWIKHQVDDILVLGRNLPFGLKMLYAPEIPWDEGQKLTQLIKNAKELGKSQNATFVRLDFFNEYLDNHAQRLQKLGLKKSFEDVQPEFRQWIDIGGTEEQILAQMKQKGRYNIRLAEKHGVEIKSENDPDIFLKLFTETAQRDHFSIRRLGYYKDLIETLATRSGPLEFVPPKDGSISPASRLALHSTSLSASAEPMPLGFRDTFGSEQTTRPERPSEHSLGELLVAWYKKRPLAAAIISYYGEFATYLYGASASLNRELMAPYLLHWQAIQNAKQRGCKIYDLLAVSPTEDQLKAKSPATAGSRLGGDYKLTAKYAGISRFKEQFGGKTVHLLGSWDLILKPFAYQLFKLVENLRRS